MKKSILMLSMICFINMESKAQQENWFITANSLIIANPVSLSIPAYNTPNKDADYYFRKSKNNRAVGWATLGGGILLSGIGLLLANGDYATNNANSNTADVLTIAGAVSGIVSIPFMIMAGVYKHKAKVMVSSQKTGFGVPQNVDKNIMDVTISLPIGR
jgi:hypothetical protein